ncbi:MAG: hypothetical protein J7M05_00230, partial [Anaerolineae bacterium]|nr:hypothetical protein [Anaerolineae bacterium]
MRNPYIIDRPLTEDDLFFGREKLFEQLGRYLSNGQRLLLLYGKRRMGKTSFLNQLPLRLSPRWAVAYCSWASLPSEGQRDPLWGLLLGASVALDQAPPVRTHYEKEPLQYALTYLEKLSANRPPLLLCYDDLTTEDLHPSAWEEIFQALRERLPQGMAILLAIRGTPWALRSFPYLAEIPSLQLGPLEELDAEELLTITARRKLNYSYEALQRIRQLSGGEPFLLQLFGSALFEARAEAGWVDLPAVEHALPHVMAMAEELFEEEWEASTPAEQLVLCALSTMAGRYGIASPSDVAHQLATLHIQASQEDILQALESLQGREVLERLGGDTFRFSSELQRHWVKEKHNALEVLQRTKQFRRVRPRRNIWRGRRIDWVSLLLWAIAGLLVLAIAFVWQSRKREVIHIGEPTPAPATLQA